MSRIAHLWIDNAEEPCEEISFDTFGDLTASLTDSITRYGIGDHLLQLRGGKRKLNAKSLPPAPEVVHVHVKQVRPGELAEFEMFWPAVPGMVSCCTYSHPEPCEATERCPGIQSQCACSRELLGGPLGTHSRGLLLVARMACDTEAWLSTRVLLIAQGIVLRRCYLVQCHLRRSRSLAILSQSPNKTATAAPIQQHSCRGQPLDQM